MQDIHITAEVDKTAKIGKGTKIWNYSQIRENVVIGDNCIIGKNVYIDFAVKIGNNCKIQNNVSIYHGVVIGNGVFVGPNVVLTNDKVPRSINSDGSLKQASDWNAGKITIQNGVSLGAGTIVLPNTNIGQHSMVGAGSVITHNIEDYMLVFGNPARFISYICSCGIKLNIISKKAKCTCKKEYILTNGKLKLYD